MTNLLTAIRSAASSRRADAVTMAGDFPPNSRVTEARCSAADFITSLATPGDPVKKMGSNGNFKSSAATSAPPSTTKTNDGSKISVHNRLRIADVLGVSSDGFTITTFPAAKAETNGPIHKLKG